MPIPSQVRMLDIELLKSMSSLDSLLPGIEITPGD